MPPLRIALAQINATVGDLAGNAAKVADYAARAAGWGADLVVFPELVLTGYPPEDLVFRPDFVDANRRWLDWLARRAAGGPALVVGFVDADRDLYNAAAVIRGGRVRAVARKRFLPNYSVFDERRYFSPGAEALVIRLGGIALGVTICEEIWFPGGPLREQALAGGAELILNLSASPFQAGKAGAREGVLRSRAADYGVAIAYANLVGGQDELVFDGRSLIVTAGGEVAARGRPFAEDLILWDFDPRESFSRRMYDARWRHVPPSAEERARVRVVNLDEPEDRRAPDAGTAGTGVLAASGDTASSGHRAGAGGTPGTGSTAGTGGGPGGVPGAEPAGRGKPSLPAPDDVPELAGEAEIYAALVLAVRDYARKNGFSGAVLGLSGGIDSALVATIAADALGPERVVGVRMPSPFTSEASLRDAAEVAANLGIRLETIPIA
ncbi:MAG TPA: nitrilase-related carbon-nitrogen hydrolase, partial [Thermaerobacter sp.]